MGGTMRLMYWIWSFSHMFVMYLTLLNFFLAIIVEGFSNVQTKLADCDVESSLWADVYDSIGTRLTYRREKWPNHFTLLQTWDTTGALEKEEPVKVVINSSSQQRAATSTPILLPAGLAELRDLFPSMESLKLWCFYYRAKLATTADVVDE